MNPIEVETKTDRELLIQVVDKVNEISRDMKEVCLRADKAEERSTVAAKTASELATDVQVLKNRVDSHATQMKVILGFQLSTILLVIASFIRQVLG